MLKLQEENNMSNTQVKQLQDEVTDLGYQINAWKNNLFLHEKFAREQLHMARSGDTIFYLS